MDVMYLQDVVFIVFFYSRFFGMPVTFMAGGRRDVSVFLWFLIDLAVLSAVSADKVRIC